MELVPEDRFDRQPVWSHDRTAGLVADVRLDNRSALIAELHLTASENFPDSLLLLHAWLRWQEACLDHIVGGFAFAVWMPTRKLLFAARDHAGECPLFFHRGDGLFALASMPHGLQAIPGVGTVLDDMRLASELILQPALGTETFFRGIERLLPGHLLRAHADGSVETRRYWHPSGARPTRYKHNHEYAEALVEQIDRATAPRLRSVGAVGTHLSAGLDSASVTASAALQLRAQGRSLTAFTSVPRPDFNRKRMFDRLIDEGPGAADVAAMYPEVEHVLIDSTGMNFLRELKHATDAQAAPLVNPGNQTWIMKALEEAGHRGIKVLLNGTAGNATISFDGTTGLRQMFRQGRWLQLARTAHTLRQDADLSFRASAGIALGGVLPASLKQRLHPALQDLNFCAVNPRLAEEFGLLAQARQGLDGDVASVAEEQSRYFDRFDAGASAAFGRALTGIDERDPTADKRVWEFCFSLPPEQWLVGGHSRSLVRRAMRGRLPESTLKRVRRGIQAPDWYLMVQEVLPEIQAELTEIERSPVAARVLDLGRMRWLLEHWPEDGFETDAVLEAWDLALLRGLAMGYFIRTHDPAWTPAETPEPAGAHLG